MTAGHNYSMEVYLPHTIIGGEMFSAKRRMDPMDIGMLMWGACMQLSLEFSDSSAASAAVEEAIRIINAFRTRVGIINYISTDFTPSVHDLPSDLPSLTAVTEWIAKAHPPRPRTAMATIAAGGNRVAINICHSLADARYLVRITEHLSDPTRYKSLKTPRLSESFYDYFAPEIAASTPWLTCSTNPDITRIRPKSAVDPPSASRFVTQYLREPISSLPFFDAAAGRTSRMKELIWMGLALSNLAWGGTGFGCSNVIDLRRYRPPGDATDALQNWVGLVQLSLKPSMEARIADVAAQMTNLLHEKIAKKEWLRQCKLIHNTVWRPWIKTAPEQPFLGVEMSSVGLMTIKPPLTNAHLTMTVPDGKRYQGISFLNYSLRDLGKQQTTFVGMFQHTTQELNPKDARIIVDSIGYVMKNIDFNRTIGDAVEEVRRFQESRK
jgi:hypothetical protein